MWKLIEQSKIFLGKGKRAKMDTKSAEEVLEMMIRTLLVYIEELLEYKDTKDQQFQYGERLAYTECLEWIQSWRYAKINGLDFDIEQKYPL